MDKLLSSAIGALEESLTEFPSPPSQDAATAGSRGGSASAVAQSHGIDLVPEDALPPSVVESARRVLTAWEEIDLEGKREAWDAQSLLIAEFQETSAKNRKSLADATKAFKSGSGDKKEFAGLLKSYQVKRHIPQVRNTVTGCPCISGTSRRPHSGLNFVHSVDRRHVHMM